MNAKALLSLVVAALTLAATPARAQGFAGLGADVGGFAQVVPGRAIVFPADHGPHPEFRVEWWYVTANLSDANGASYGVQWTLFRQAVRPAAPTKAGRHSSSGWDMPRSRAPRHTGSPKSLRAVAWGRPVPKPQPLTRGSTTETLRSISQDFAPLELTARQKTFPMP